MPNQHNPCSITPSGAALLVAAAASATTLTGLVAAQAVIPNLHVYLGAGPLLGTITCLCTSGFIVQMLVRLLHRLDEIDAKVSGVPAAQPPSWNQAVSTRPLRRPLYDQKGRLALADPVTEATERRALMEAHLRDQLAAEVEDIGEQSYAEGYADGVTRRKDDELS